MSHATPIYALPYPDEADTADVPRDMQALAQRIEAVLPNVGIPTGAGVDWYAAAAPAGFLLCDGSAISRTTYAALFAAIGTIWGGGDGINTFNLPDTRARVVVGLNPSGPNHAALNFNDGTGVGGRRIQHAHSIAGLSGTLPPHAHAVVDPGHTHALNGGEGPNGFPTFAGIQYVWGQGAWQGPQMAQPTPTGVTVGNPTSNPAIPLAGSVGVSPGGDAPSFVTVAKVIKT